MMAASGSTVDYAKIFLPQYCSEIVPSRRTRESNNTILQSHNGLNPRSSSHVDPPRSSDNWRRFDYARLDFAPPSPRVVPLPQNDREDYVNLKSGDISGAAVLRRHSASYVNLRERGDTASQVRPRSDYYVNQKEVDGFSPQFPPSSDSYVNVGANRQSDIHFVRRGSARIETSSPRPAHLGPRWQSERSRRRSAERPQPDYQNVRPTSPNQGQEWLSTAPVPPRRSRSMAPERNPTTGEYQNLLQEDSQQSGTRSPSPMLLTPDTSQNVSKGSQRHHSELKSSPVQHSCKVSRSMSMIGGAGHISRKPVPPFTSRKVDYENLWYLVPDPHHPSTEGHYSEDDEQSLQDKKTRWRNSAVSVAPDYYDHLSPMIVRSGSFGQHSSGSTLRSNYDWESEPEYKSDGTSIASSRSSPECLSLAVSTGGLISPSHVLAKNSQREGSVVSGCEEGSHLGRFKLHYMGQCPIDRFLGPIDACVRDIIKSSHQSTKDVQADVSLSGVKLTPPDSDLLFAAFGTEHILSISSCAKNKRVVGIIFKRSRGRCVCHLFHCRDDVTPRIFVSTVNTALASISKSAMRKLKEQAVEIEKGSVIPIDVFGSVRYLGFQFNAPQQLITNGIVEALKEALRPSALTDVTLTLQAHCRPERGLFEVQENAGKEPILSSPVAEIDTVGCNVSDRRYVGIRLLDKKQGVPTVHIFHFGQAVGAAAFLAVMRDKFGVTVDEGKLSSHSSQPTWKGLVTSDHQPPPVPGKPTTTSSTQAHKGRGICRKLTFKDFICNTRHNHS